jgi:hypothetical protein
MKPTEYRKFKPNARSIAESMWGKGGTTAYKTNRQGAFYYSCSGHGGYIIPALTLTEAERAEINKFHKPDYINVIIQTINGVKCIVGADNSPMAKYATNKRTYTINQNFGPAHWEKLEVYAFEEDCAWSVIEKFTDIRIIDKKMPTDNSTLIESTFNQYYNK